jgi:hypothetical protein
LVAGMFRPFIPLASRTFKLARDGAFLGCIILGIAGYASGKFLGGGGTATLAGELSMLCLLAFVVSAVWSDILVSRRNDLAPDPSS